MKINNILNKTNLDKNDLVTLLSISDKNELNSLKECAHKVLAQNVGIKVFLRGLVEFSNICINDCFYCGIRKSNKNYERFSLNKDDILKAADWIAESNYGSMVLQSGERNDAQFIDFVEDIVKEIKHRTISDKLPNGLGITLCIGEQNYEDYKRLYDAGAHRYLLRIETTNKKLYGNLHPEYQSLGQRIECLKMLDDIGFQVGTGVMIGFPGQTIEDLADDIIFFKNMNVDMIGMGPYLSHKDTPMSDVSFDKEYNYLLSLKMIAVTRVFLKNINIASTTALQAIKPFGREAGLSFGANVFMPLVTPQGVRESYQLYDNKPCVDEVAEDCQDCSITRIGMVNREIGYNEWGDSKHFANKNKK